MKWYFTKKKGSVDMTGIKALAMEILQEIPDDEIVPIIEVLKGYTRV